MGLEENLRAMIFFPFICRSSKVVDELVTVRFLNNCNFPEYVRERNRENRLNLFTRLGLLIEFYIYKNTISCYFFT